MPEARGLSPALRDVLLALLPGALALGFWSGPRLLLNLVLALGACLACEALSLRLRRMPVRLDGSAAVTATLLAVSLPVQGAWWLVPLAAAVAILAGKGAGRGPFNPAMLGLACVLLAFPMQLSLGYFDALSSATVLERMRTGLQADQTVREIVAIGGFGQQAAASQSVALAWLAGGLFLAWRRRIAWQIPATVPAGLLLPVLAAWALNPDRNASPLFHAWAGATMLVAFFVATDPATAPAAPRARLAYGAGIGGLAWLLRGHGYPEGFAFAVLLMNAWAPLLERGRPQPATMALALPLLALAIAAGVGLANEEWAKRTSQSAILAAVLPSGFYDNDPLGEARPLAFGTLHLARKAGRPVAAIYRTRAEGYGGPIELLVALLPDGTLAGLHIVSHHETLAFAERYVGTDRSWLAAPDSRSGASVTPRAIEAAVQRVLDYHAAHRQELFAP